MVSSRSDRMVTKTPMISCVLLLSVKEWEAASSPGTGLGCAYFPPSSCFCVLKQCICWWLVQLPSELALSHHALVSLPSAIFLALRSALLGFLHPLLRSFLNNHFTFPFKGVAVCFWYSHRSWKHHPSQSCHSVFPVSSHGWKKQQCPLRPLL